jgi:hypothetical protein
MLYVRRHKNECRPSQRKMIVARILLTLYKDRRVVSIQKLETGSPMEYRVDCQKDGHIIFCCYHTETCKMCISTTCGTAPAKGAILQGWASMNETMGYFTCTRCLLYYSHTEDNRLRCTHYFCDFCAGQSSAHTRTTERMLYCLSFLYGALGRDPGSVIMGFLVSL